MLSVPVRSATHSPTAAKASSAENRMVDSYSESDETTFQTALKKPFTPRPPAGAAPPNPIAARLPGGRSVGRAVVRCARSRPELLRAATTLDRLHRWGDEEGEHEHRLRDVGDPPLDTGGGEEAGPGPQRGEHEGHRDRHERPVAGEQCDQQPLPADVGGDRGV